MIKDNKVQNDSINYISLNRLFLSDLRHEQYIEDILEDEHKMRMIMRASEPSNRHNYYCNQSLPGSSPSKVNIAARTKG